MADSIKIDDLATELANALAGYSDEVTEKVKKAVDEETKIACKELILRSPKKTGDYAADWTSKKTYEGKYTRTKEIYNKTNYQLTHLLEFGHARRGGGRTVPAIPHIKPIETTTIENFTRKVESAANGNG